MDELDLLIKKMCDEPNIWESQISMVRAFISNCTLKEFEEIKELDYDLSQNEGKSNSQKCDYRSPLCSNDGKENDGVWVCSNHLIK